MALQLNAVNNSTATFLPSAVKAQRNPSTNDTNWQPGQLWVNLATQTGFILTGFANGQAVWDQIEAGGGGGDFSSLTVDPGPTSITGQFHVNGNINEANVIQLSENGGASGTISILSNEGTKTGITGGAITIGAIEGGIQVNAALDYLITGVNSSTIQVTGADQDLIIQTANGIIDIGAEGTNGTVSIQAQSGTGQVLVLGAPVSINTGSATGATSIGNNSMGGDLTLASTGLIELVSNDDTAGAIQIRATGTASSIQIGPDATTSEIEIANIAPTVSRLTYINNGTVSTASVTDGVYIGNGATSTVSSALKFVDIATGNNLLGTTTVNIATGTCATGTKSVNIGNADGLTSINLAQSPLVITSQTIASPTVAVTNNVREGAILMTGFTTASAASTTVTLTNSFITATSVILASVSDLSTNTTAVYVNAVKPGASSCVFILTNSGAQAVNGHLQINFWVLS